METYPIQEFLFQNQRYPVFASPSLSQPVQFLEISDTIRAGEPVKKGFFLDTTYCVAVPSQNVQGVGHALIVDRIGCSTGYHFTAFGWGNHFVYLLDEEIRAAESNEEGRKRIERAQKLLRNIMDTVEEHP